jgi:hypothetical protein
MITSTRFTAATLLALAAATAHGESLRCNGQIASPGDSKLSVLRKCGEPMLRDSFCKRVEVVAPVAPVVPYPYVVAAPVIACEPVDEWLYDRGEGNLLATVRFQRGVVDDIRYEGRNR